LQEKFKFLIITKKGKSNLSHSQEENKEIILEFKKVTKQFGDFFANQDISFIVQRGSIHAIIGENGAGKSTLMKILFGLYEASAGEIFLKGNRIAFKTPIQAKSAGLGMVHQHFMLAGPISALDHIILDQAQQSSFIERIFPLKRAVLEKQITKLSEKFKMPVPWQEKIENLSVGIQQRIEILKILFNQSEILILDEPTAVLTPQEVDAFFDQLRSLKAAGKTIIIITHKLKEVLKLADNFTVLRQGKIVHTGPLVGHTTDSLGELMIGRRPHKIQASIQDSSPDKKSQSNNANIEPLLQFFNFNFTINNKHILRNLNFQIMPGEIVGIAGVEGNGQSDILNLLIRPQFFLDKKQGEFSGHVELINENHISKTPSEIRELGLSYFPEDRLHQALLLDMAAEDNFLLGQQYRSEFQKNKIINWSEVRTQASKSMKDFDVRPQNLELALGQFSGGNQQKFVVSRELYKSPKILIAAQPTRGVDIGAIESIHSQIVQCKSKGSAVLLVSSDLDELMNLSDRILVIFQGEILGEFAGPNYDEKKLGALMGGGRI
jgi:simple sugar transport system ATP-binding protein